MEKKYIIKLEENEIAYKTVNSNGCPMIGLLHPVPYTEPDLEQVKKEAYDKCRGDVEMLAHKLYSPKIDGAYQRGLNDAWEAARKIIHMPEGDLLNIFTECYSAVCTALQVLLKYDASECIEKIRQYEQGKEKQEKLKKEQSVTAEDVMRQYLDMFCKDGKSCTECPLHTQDFTCGRGYHFLTTKAVSDEEVRRAYAKVLQKMREG